MLKLVIADDEKIIRETIRNFIDWQSIGIEVVGVCSNGVEAYETILDYYPDIVLTDIKMPGFSGLELVKRLKKLTIIYNLLFYQATIVLNMLKKLCSLAYIIIFLSPATNTKLLMPSMQSKKIATSSVLF